MSKLLSFAGLASTYLNSDQAPEKIEFSQSNALQTSVEGLANAASVEYDLTPNKSVAEHVADYEKMTKNRLLNGELLQPFDDMANMFARKIYDGITNLKQIKRDVTWLTEDIMKKYHQYVSEDPVVSAYTGERNFSTLSMPAVDWSLMNKISERVTIARVHEKIDHEDDAPITDSMIRLAINRLPGVSDDRVCEPVGDLKKEKVDRIIDMVYSSVKDQCTREEVTNVVKSALYLTPDHLRQAANSIAQFADGRTVDKINTYMNQVRLGDLILPHITDDVTDVSAANRQRINHNVELIQEINHMVAYVAIHYRNTVWRDAIMVPGPMVNSDNMDQFQGKGGSLESLVLYHNYLYKETGVPSNGVSVQFALESIGRVSEEYKLEAARQAATCEEHRKQYLRDAFIHSSLEYLNSHKEKFSPQFASNNLVAYVSSVYDSAMLEAPMENRLYDLILNSCFINSMERNIYHRLNAAYIKHANSAEALTDEMCDRIDVSVYSDMIAEYLVDKGILIAK